MEVENFKKEYNIYLKKYGLPGFSELNRRFEIDKIEKESECLLRVIRKVMMDKVINSLSFLDMLLNPMNAPRIYLSFIKNMSSDDKKEIDSVYGKLGELALSCLPLELNYDEKKEADMIKSIYSKWSGLDEEFGRILEKMSRPNSATSKKEKSYFG